MCVCTGHVCRRFYFKFYVNSLMGPSLGEVTFYMMYTASCLPVYLYVEVPVGKCINAGSMVAGMVRIGMRQERGKTESERWKQRKRLQVTRNRMT